MGLQKAVSLKKHKYLIVKITLGKDLRGIMYLANQWAYKKQQYD
jgi:hypothetical protein